MSEATAPDRVPPVTGATSLRRVWLLRLVGGLAVLALVPVLVVVVVLGAVLTGMIRIEGRALFGDHPRVILAFDRFEQRPTCRPARVAHHSLVALYTILPEDRLKRIATGRLSIDGIGPITDIRYHQDDDPPRYSFPNLFDKPRHFEIWRPKCQFGYCLFPVQFYAHAHGVPAGDHDIVLDYADAAGAHVHQDRFEAVHIASEAEARTAPYLDVDAWIDGDRLHGTVDSTGDQELTFKFQIDDDLSTGWREEFETWETVPAGRISADHRFEGRLDYAGVFAYEKKHLRGPWRDLVARITGLIGLPPPEIRPVSTENKVELVNSSDPYMRCP